MSSSPYLIQVTVWDKRTGRLGTMEFTGDAPVNLLEINSVLGDDHFALSCFNSQKPTPYRTLK